MVLAIIMLATVASVFEFGAQDAGLAAHGARRTQALYLAEAGLARTYTWLEAQDDPPGDTEEFWPFGGDPDTLAEGTYIASVVPDADNPSGSRKYFTIRCAATTGDKTRVLETDVMTQSYAQFIYFTEDEHLPGSTTPVWFCTQDALDGSLHTNGQLHLWGRPVVPGSRHERVRRPGRRDPHSQSRLHVLQQQLLQPHRVGGGEQPALRRRRSSETATNSARPRSSSPTAWMTSARSRPTAD